MNSETSNQSKVSFEKTHTIELIDNDFTTEEANELLTHLLRSKIKFLKHQRFSSYERFGIHSEHTNQRITALEHELERLHALLRSVKNKDQVLSLNCEVQIKFP
ncbi:hypothetical protein [Persicobacter psychrovividus]|uniref:50S ribosomal protein L29 n=1 Tax=Persicobacter psychrovividus TaxID=387638 RepID=A0ABM7VBT6_9BACT|nr:hypothetical protein PEPS_04350 [Persicobacter psychrovividus]